MKKIIVLYIALLSTVVSKSQGLNFNNDTNWFRNGPYSAWVTSLKIAPSNPDVIYIGTRAAGIYKTINGGELWTYCSTENLPEWEDSLPSGPGGWWNGDYYPIDDIAVDPQNTEHVWIGTSQRGLFESIDGGESWQKADTSLPGLLAVKYILINENNPDKIFIGAGHYSENGGLYKTENGGDYWYLIEDIAYGSTYSITDIKRDPSNNEHIIVGITSAGEEGFPWGLMESYDNGDSWQQVTDAFPVYDISINPENNQNIWGVVYTGYLDWLLFFSNDGGQNWDLYEGFEDPYKWVTSMYADAGFNLYIEQRN